MHIIRGQFIALTGVLPKKSLRHTGNTLLKLMHRSCIIMAIATTTSAGFAQSPTGTIRGTITDRSGAVVSNATITIINTQTNETKSTQSDNEGRYIINFVQPSIYSATASASGFESAKQNNIIIEISVGRSIDLVTIYLTGQDQFAIVSS